MSGHLKATNEKVITINSLPVDLVLSNASVRVCSQPGRGMLCAEGGIVPPPILGNLVNKSGSYNM